MDPTPLLVRPAQFPGDLDAARALFLAYRETPGVAECVVSFDAEVAGLPGRYAAEAGGELLLGFVDGNPVACGAYRQIAPGVGELKRLFVSETARGLGAGRTIARQLIASARATGYAAVRLDTLPSMLAAISLYRSLGFREIERYYDNAPPQALFFELSL